MYYPMLVCFPCVNFVDPVADISKALH